MLLGKNVAGPLAESNGTSIRKCYSPKTTPRSNVRDAHPNSDCDIADRFNPTTCSPLTCHSLHARTPVGNETHELARDSCSTAVLGFVPKAAVNSPLPDFACRPSSSGPPPSSPGPQNRRIDPPPPWFLIILSTLPAKQSTLSEQILWMLYPYCTPKA